MNTKLNEMAEGLLRNYQEIQSQIKSYENTDNNVKRAEVLSKVRLLLGRVKDIEVELFPLRDQWIQGGNELSDSTKSYFQQSAEIVGDLLPRIKSLESEARSDREKLAPVIHEGVRGMQMHSAYSQNR